MTNKKLKIKCDRDFSKYIRKRDKNICFTCSEFGDENGHLFRRGILSLRYNEYNCNCQCSDCNREHETNPQKYINKFVEVYGIDKYNELDAQKNKLVKIDYNELRTKIALKNKQQMRS